MIKNTLSKLNLIQNFWKNNKKADSVEFFKNQSDFEDYLQDLKWA